MFGSCFKLSTMTMDLERGMEMINQNKNQTNGNGLGENKYERGKMTSWLERWWDEEKDGEEGNDSEATFSVVNATQIMRLRPMFFSLIPFFFLAFKFVFSLSLFHIFSLSLSLFHSEALRDTKMFSTETSYINPYPRKDKI